jgi:hypothetical protein
VGYTLQNGTKDYSAARARYASPAKEWERVVVANTVEMRRKKTHALLSV